MLCSKSPATATFRAGYSASSSTSARRERAYHASSRDVRLSFWYPVVSTQYAFSPKGYVVVGRNDAYSIELVKDGALVGVFEHDADPVEVLPGEAEEWNDWAEYFARRLGVPNDYGSPPKLKPWFKALHVGRMGRIWVHRYALAEERAAPEQTPGHDRPTLVWRERATYDVFEEDGTFLWTVVMPWNTVVHARSGDTLWAVQVTDDGEHVVRFRVRPLAVSNAQN